MYIQYLQCEKNTTSCNENRLHTYCGVSVQILDSVSVSLFVCVLQVLVQFLSMFQWCSKCEGERCACLVSWVHLQEGPLVIVEGLHHFSETDTRVVVGVPAKRGEMSSKGGGRGKQEMGGRGRAEQDEGFNGIQ